MGQGYGGIVKPKVARYPEPGVETHENDDCREREDCPIEPEEDWADIRTTGGGMQWVVVHRQNGRGAQRRQCHIGEVNPGAGQRTQGFV